MKHKIIVMTMIILASGVNGRGQKTVNAADILQTPGWLPLYDSYQPDGGLLAEMKPALPGKKAVVYFGAWCDDSKNNVPQFLKIIDSLNEPEFEVVFFAVDKKSATGQKYYVENLQVEKVPTFIFYIGDTEIGRIVENPKESMLQDMVRILF